MTKYKAKENMLASEQIAQEFAAQGIPAVCALRIEGRILHEIEGRLGMFYPVIPGVQKYYPEFGLNELEKIATILAKMHGMGLVSHRDFDPKNVLWVGIDPYIIDWEAAGPIDPMEELVALAFEWSGFERGEVDPTLFSWFFEAYTLAGGKVIEANLQQGLQNFMNNYEEWLAFNERRATLAETQNEKALAHREKAKTEIKLKMLSVYRHQRLLPHRASAGTGKTADLNFEPKSTAGLF